MYLRFLFFGLLKYGIDHKEVRRALKMSGLKPSSVVPPPAIRIKPKMTMAIPTASKMKLVRVNAN